MLIKEVRLPKQYNTETGLDTEEVEEGKGPRRGERCRD